MGGLVSKLVERKWTSLLAIVALLTRFSQRFRRGVILLLLESELGVRLALQLSRALLGHLFPPLLVHWWFTHPQHIGHDGSQVLHNLEYTRRIRYGSHEREELDILLPKVGPNELEKNAHSPSGILHLGAICAQELGRMAVFGHPKIVDATQERSVDHSAPAILFGHGGGWVVQGTDVQLQQLTALARQGFAIYAFNYPLAPEDRFPVALVSTLRALSWLKTEKGYERAALLGESAGGNLITMAAAVVCNPPLLKELAECSGEAVDQWVYPEITCVVSWYSILCTQHWRGQGWLSKGLDKVMEMYISESNAFGNRIALCDLENDLENYPPSYFIAGTQDPLGLTESSKAAHSMLGRKNLASTYKEYDDTHGFVGYPVQMQQAVHGGIDKWWKLNARDALSSTSDFFNQHHRRPKII